MTLTTKKIAILCGSQEEAERLERRLGEVNFTEEYRIIMDKQALLDDEELVTVTEEAPEPTYFEFQEDSYRDYIRQHSDVLLNTIGLGKKHESANIIDIRTEPKIGRNSICPCGSNKKYKNCCINN